MEYQRIKAAVRAAGHVFFDRGAYNLNLIGVRTADDAANTFNDRMHIAYRDELGGEHCLCFRITTDPGVKYRVNPLNSRGTGIIVPGQHRGLWRVGVHKGEHPALVQSQPVKVYRDNDKDIYLDEDDSTIESVIGGFNCHRSSPKGTSRRVDGWSAGCQVFANCYDHDILMALCNRSAVMHGNSFSYTLLREAQLHG